MHRSYEKVGLIYNVLNEPKESYDSFKAKTDIEIVGSLLQTEGDINYDIPKCGDGPNVLFSRFFQDMSAKRLTFLNLLLDSGVDFTRKNVEGRTALLERIHYQPLSLVRGPIENDFVNAVLTAHVKFNNSSNPSDANGMSHFHAACITNSASVVEFFLKNGVNVDQSMKADSLIFPLDTPLQLAARSGCVKAVEVLLRYGANVISKNGDGMTPMHVLVDVCKLGLERFALHERTLRVLFEFVINENIKIETIDDYGFCNLHVACLFQDESLVESVLESTGNINQAVKLNSPVCPGYTALHFAAYLSVDIFKLLLDKGANVEAKNTREETPIDLFLQKYGVSELHSILSLRSEWRNIVLSDNQTKLLDVVSAMEAPDEFISFLNFTNLPLTTHVSFDSPLWPGYTILHLASIFTKSPRFLEDRAYPRVRHDDSIVAECLKRGADVTAADVAGSTALHLAFYKEKRYVVELLLNHHDKLDNPVDRHCLSHFHIACAAAHSTSVERSLSNGVNVNNTVGSTFRWHTRAYRHFYICAGSTPLHISVAAGNYEITEMLLKHGADVNAKDVNGYTPVHRLLTSVGFALRQDPIIDLLLSDEKLGNSVANGGLSHLHVASYYNHIHGIERLIDSGADVNGTVTYKRHCKRQYYEEGFDDYGDPDDPLICLFRYQGYAPLHFSMLRDRYCDDIELLLISRGADVAKECASGTSFLNRLSGRVFFNKYRYTFDRISTILKDCRIVREHLEERFGWTKLHFASCTADLESVKSLIRLGANVNARISSDSPVWRGYTPLHAVLRMTVDNYNRKDVDRLKKVAKALMKSGADVTLMDDDGDTALHYHSFSKENSFVQNLLFKYTKNYSVNPTNFRGISLFHIACATQNVSAIDEFLRHGVDINQAISYFSEECPGATPLHLIIKYYEPTKLLLVKIGWSDDPVLRVIETLMRSGADVNRVDGYGNTPLFEAIASEKLCGVLVPKLISNGADVHVKNAKAITPFESMLSHYHVSSTEIELLMKFNCHFNTYNPLSKTGYIAQLFRFGGMNIFFDLSCDKQIIEIDDTGRTVMHNLVSIEDSELTIYTEAIEWLIAGGCEIDHQDNEGKTALHLAAHFWNSTAILGLMKNGADINLVDKSGKTFFAYIHETPEPVALQLPLWCPRDVEGGLNRAFAMHVFKLEFCGLYVDERNKDLQVEIVKRHPLKDDVLDRFHGEIEKIKKIKIGTTFGSVHNFLMNLDAGTVYTNMVYEEREVVDRFFRNIGKHKFSEIDCLLKLKYRQTIERIRLVEPAARSLNVLVEGTLPDLCCQSVLKFLKNEDLKRLIASGIS